MDALHDIANCKVALQLFRGPSPTLWCICNAQAAAHFSIVVHHRAIQVQILSSGKTIDGPTSCRHLAAPPSRPTAWGQ